MATSVFLATPSKVCWNIFPAEIGSLKNWRHMSFQWFIAGLRGSFRFLFDVYAKIVFCAKKVAIWQDKPYPRSRMISFLRRFKISLRFWSPHFKKAILSLITIFFFIYNIPIVDLLPDRRKIVVGDLKSVRSLLCFQNSKFWITLYRTSHSSALKLELSTTKN